jgi:hypothetical protein
MSIGNILLIMLLRLMKIPHTPVLYKTAATIKIQLTLG